MAFILCQMLFFPVTDSRVLVVAVAAQAADDGGGGGHGGDLQNSNVYILNA